MHYFVFAIIFCFRVEYEDLIFCTNFLVFHCYHISYNMIAYIYAYNMISIPYDYMICQVFGVLCQV